MRDLAVFEHYIDSFAITPQIVKERGFDKQPPDFYCLVADSVGLIGGMLVYYFLNYTAQNQPAVYIKELYVAENFRNQKIGEKLDARCVCRSQGQRLWPNQMDRRRVEQCRTTFLPTLRRGRRQRMAELCVESRVINRPSETNFFRRPVVCHLQQIVYNSHKNSAVDTAKKRKIGDNTA